MPHHRAPRAPARSRRALALESLEPRAVPAGLAQIVELDLNDRIDIYDVANENGSGLLIGDQRGEEVPIERLNNQGQSVGTIDLAPAPGYLKARIDDLSEDGRWALGTSYMPLGDAAAGRVDYRPTLWRLSDPSSPIDLPPVTGDDDPIEGRSDLSNAGTFFAWTRQGRLFLIGPTASQELSFPPGTSPVQPGFGRFGYFNGITPNGRTFVGSLRVSPPPQPPPPMSGTLEIIGVPLGVDDPQPIPITRFHYGEIYDAAVWRDGQPTLLPVGPTYISSLANAVSDDGRLIGGAVLSENNGRVAAVWFDGQLRTLQTASGDPFRGDIRHVANGIGGDPTRWLAFGTLYHHGFNEVTFVADQTGIAVPLSQWLRENYGLQADLKAFTLTDVLLDGDRLRLFSSKTGFDPPIIDCPSCGVPAFLVHTGTQMITIDLQAQSQPQSLDVDSNGHITPADALLVIDALNAQLAAGHLDGSLPPGPNSAPLDVNSDGFLTAADALIIINHLNHTSVAASTSATNVPAAEGESSSTRNSTDLSILAADLLFQDLASPRRIRTGLSL